MPGAKTLRDIMTKDPRSARPDTPVHEVAQMMKREDVGSIPIVDNKKLVGIVTDRDLCLSVIAERQPYDAPIANFMTTRPETGTPDMTVHRAAQIMQTHQIRRLPVCDEDGALVGIVALADLALDTESEGLKADTLEEVSVPNR